MVCYVLVLTMYDQGICFALSFDFHNIHYKIIFNSMRAHRFEYLVGGFAMFKNISST